MVSGAGSGIGQAIAAHLAAARAQVYLAEIDPEKGEAAANQIREYAGGRAEFVQTDVALESSCRAAAQRVLEAHREQCDILVNNAGIGHVGTALTTTPADLDRLYSVNVRGVLHLAQAFLPAMLARRCGSVIDLASIGGISPRPRPLAYCATKFAVVGMTK